VETLTLAEAAEAIAARQFSPLEYLDGLLAYICLRVDEARAAARAAGDEIVRDGVRSPLHGIPIGVKDIIDIAGLSTTCHSKLLLDQVAEADAQVIGQLRRAGAIFPGKLATHEFAFGGPSFDLPFPPARNPWNRDHHPGGSSSGSAAVVAGRMLPAALGSDTGGSIRHPAGHCGIVGLKPTYDLVSRKGVFPLAYSLDTIGPMTRTVRDNAILLEQMGTGAERRDYTRHLDGGARGLKIGFVRQFHEEDLVAAPDIIAALDEAAAVFRREGAIVQDVRLPSLAEFDNVTRLILIAEATAIHERWLRQRPEDYAELTRQRMLPGFFFSATDYIQAQRRRTELALAIEEAFWEADILLVANSMDEACRIDDRSEIDFTYPRQARMPFNTSGHPAISLMCGRGEKYGMPLSLQLVGRPFDEALLYRAASAFERATPWKDQAPNLDSLIVAKPEVPAPA
jgi:aspartyl-tRNA(Asn)/glutamyl-tRNA(Gln) amidotransferase subunit A